MDKKTNIINTELVLYAIRNKQGSFFRAKGYGGSGNTWVPDINKAKIYPRIGGARGVITWFATHYPEYPVLDLLKLTIGKIELLDETKRVTKVKEKKAKAEAEVETREAERKLVEAKSALLDAQKRIARYSKYGK